MSKVRHTSWGSTPVFVVDYVDQGGTPREATFHHRGEAQRFAAEQDAAERPAAAPAAIQRANRTLLARISGRAAPKNAPRTLHGVLQRITCTMQTRGR